jgi:large subunit ribosomal protein L14
MLTKLKIIDNSGATQGRIIKILNKKKDLKVGCLVLVSILRNIPNSKVRKGDIYKAVIVTGSTVNSYTLKSIILVKVVPKGTDYIPLGTRIKGPVSSILKKSVGMLKVLHLSKRTF